MKYAITFFFLSFMLVTTYAQKCCDKPKQKTSANAEFAALGSDEQFRMQHDLPKPAAYLNLKGEMIRIPVENGKDVNAYFIKNKEETDKYLFVFHEWWGLNDQVKKESDRYFESLGDCHVVALDLYDGAVATTRDKASELMQSMSEKRAREIILASFQWAGVDARVATIGWCFGGGWSLQAAIYGGEKTAACVMFYGMPEKDTDRLKKLQCDVLGIFAKQDGWINEEVINNFKANMEKAGKDLTVKVYDAAHAFANPTRDVYDEQAAKDAYRKAIKFIDERL